MTNPRKLVDLQQLRAIIADLRAAGQRVVFTNGCFDIIHPGHILHLQQARQEGNVLVVALNSDESVRQLKGPGRPVFSQQERATVLAALEPVDYVTIFDTPPKSGCCPKSATSPLLMSSTECATIMSEGPVNCIREIVPCRGG